MSRTALHFLWEGREVCRKFRTGVSLHGHTLHSRESLDFIPRIAVKVPFLPLAVRAGERVYRRVNGAPLKFTRGWWTPPLSPRDAVLLETRQIETSLGMSALVSITDHDNIEAADRLHVISEGPKAPVSVEWTVPYGGTFFHLGIHNMPAERAHGLMGSMAAFTAAPDPSKLAALLESLQHSRETLIVLNHPFWDENGVGPELHCALAREIVALHGQWIHALELNGLRPWQENRAVLGLSRETGLPLISGGDRHGVEPNAILNATNASTFAEFVGEIRFDRVSNVVFMPQYREPFVLRIIHNTYDILTDHPDHGLGWRLWSDRVFYQCEDGVVRSLTECWGGNPPAVVKQFIGLMRLVKHRPMQSALRLAFGEREELAL